MWKVYALMAAIFAALTAICAKVGVKEIDSNLATAVRTTVVLVLTWAIALVATGGHLVSPLKSVGQTTWWFLILSGLCTGASWLCYFKAIQLGPVSRVAPVDKLSVVFVVIIAALFLGESLGWKVALGAVLICAGSLLMLVK